MPENINVTTTRITSTDEALALAVTPELPTLTITVDGQSVSVVDEMALPDSADAVTARSERSERAHVAIHSTVGRAVLLMRVTSIKRYVLDLHPKARYANAIGPCVALMAALQNDADNETVAALTARLVKLLPSSVAGDGLATTMLADFRRYYRGVERVTTEDWRASVSADYAASVDKARTERQRAISAAHNAAVNRWQGLILPPAMEN